MTNKLFLPDNFKIAITGSHSCGKTSLIKILSKKIDIPTINEIAATFDPDSRLLMQTQYNIMSAQIQSESQYSTFLSDRSVIDNLAYSTLVYKNDPLINKQIYDNCNKMAYNHLLNKPYNLLIFVDEILPLRPSPHRNFMDKRDQVFIYQFIKDEFKNLNGNGYFGIPVLKVSGDIKCRLNKILNYLEQIN